MKYRFKVEWNYTDACEVHTTYVECNHCSVRSALKSFHSFFNRIHDVHRDFGYVVLSVVYLGVVIKKFW